MNEFGIFLKEGLPPTIPTDDLVRLLRFESSASEPGKLISWRTIHLE